MSGKEPEEIKVLIERARGKDESALNELLDVHTRRLLESVRSDLGDRLRQRLESQDVMQQVYLDALKGIEGFVDRGEGSFFAWLRRIAVNRICDVDRRAFKTAKRKGEIRAADIGGEASAIHLLDCLAGSQTSPSMAVDFADRVRALDAAINRLHDDQREAIRLRYFSLLTVEETAAEMKRSEGAVRSLCVRALIHLRELIGDAI